MGVGCEFPAAKAGWGKGLAAVAFLEAVIPRRIGIASLPRGFAGNEGDWRFKAACERQQLLDEFGLGFLAVERWRLMDEMNGAGHQRKEHAFT